MTAILKILNLIASTGSAAAAIIALSKPELLSRSRTVEAGEIFYMRLYAARSIPLGVTFGLLPFYFRGPAAAWVLFTASAIQWVDVAIQISRKDKGALAPTTAAIVHFACGLSMF